MSLFIGHTSKSSKVMGFVVLFIYSACICHRPYLPRLHTHMIHPIPSARTILIRLPAYLDHPSRSSFPPRAHTTRKILLRLRRWWRAPRVPKDEQRKEREHEKHHRACLRIVAHVHVGTCRAREVETLMMIVEERLVRVRSVRLPRSGCCPRRLRQRRRQTWCTPMTMENMEKRTEQSEAVCGRGSFFLWRRSSNLYYISLELLG
jgi:hypothetical protein